MQQSRPSDVVPIGQNYNGYLSRWSVGVTNRDTLVARHQAVSIEQSDPIFIRRDIEGQSTVVTEIKPRPVINRVGTKSKPFRLLSGQEIQLSEDDIRVEGISKAYRPESIAAYGIYYQIGDPDPLTGSVALYDLIFVDDSDPLTYKMTIRKREDNRYKGYNYDQLP